MECRSPTCPLVRAPERWVAWDPDEYSIGDVLVSVRLLATAGRVHYRLQRPSSVEEVEEGCQHRVMAKIQTERGRGRGKHPPKSHVWDEWRRPRVLVAPRMLKICSNLYN
jgi:hypothetical protein